MIRKGFEKHEPLFCLLLIFLYLILNTLCLQSLETTDWLCALMNTVFSAALLILTRHLGKTATYGLTRVANPNQYLFFIPLVLIASVNLWGGIQIQNTPMEILIHFITMMNVGFIEELLFRGFLYRMMEKRHPKTAAFISAVTFGLGHLLNLTNGAELIPTLLQLGYAIAIGWLFVVFFRKSHSILPCIITHGILNALSVFNTEHIISTTVSSVFLVIIALGYAFYIDKDVVD